MISPKKRLETCLHEACHAVVSLALGHSCTVKIYDEHDENDNTGRTSWTADQSGEADKVMIGMAPLVHAYLNGTASEDDIISCKYDRLDLSDIPLITRTMMILTKFADKITRMSSELYRSGGGSYSPEYLATASR